ncbi:hypothetical protein GCM10027612_87030 [Microbispora bryophytorum subsp. camponoti]
MIDTAGQACGGRPEPPPAGTGPQAARPDGGRARGRCAAARRAAALILYERNSAGENTEKTDQTETSFCLIYISPASPCDRIHVFGQRLVGRQAQGAQPEPESGGESIEDIQPDLTGVEHGADPGPVATISSATRTRRAT